MTARACSFLFVCLLGSSLLHADDAGNAARRPSGIGHQPAAPGQRQPAPASQPAKGAAPAAASDNGPFKLTVDAIMAGPKLVGYPPTGLRWSGDSQRLYFEWRRPEDDEAATWVVGRNGGEPRRLSDDERKLAPPVFGSWDKAHRRILAVQDGDVVLFDTVAQTRRVLTKTSATESNPRWTHNETAITFTRENALFLMPLTGDGDGLMQLTEAGPKKQEPRLTDSQKFVKAEEESLIDYVKEQTRKQKKNEEKRDREGLPKIEITERQSVPDLLLAHDDAYAYAVVVDRAQGSKRADVPNYVSVS